MQRKLLSLRRARNRKHVNREMAIALIRQSELNPPQWNWSENDQILSSFFLSPSKDVPMKNQSQDHERIKKTYQKPMECFETFWLLVQKPQPGSALRLRQSSATPATALSPLSSTLCPASVPATPSIFLEGLYVAKIVANSSWCYEINACGWLNKCPPRLCVNEIAPTLVVTSGACRHDAVAFLCEEQLSHHVYTVCIDRHIMHVWIVYTYIIMYNVCHPSRTLVVLVVIFHLDNHS